MVLETPSSLLRQMEQHKQVKAKRGDLEYFDYILSKEERVRDQRDNKINDKRMMEEEKVVSDKQIEKHAPFKYQVKRRQLDWLRRIE